MKVLYFGIQNEEQDYGGSVIRKRNLSFLEELVGEENIVLHLHSLNDSDFTRRTTLLQGLIGTELQVDKELLRKINNVDTVFIDGTLFSSFSVSALRKSRVITFFHNVEYDFYCQMTVKFCGLRSILKRGFYKAALYNYEKRICRYSDTIITLNKKDSERLRQLYGRESDLILPTSMTDSYSEKEHSNISPYLLFVGSDFFGNTDGLFWFCEHCMPTIKLPLIVAGRGMDKYKDKYRSDNIRFYGYVDDLAELYRNAVAVVLPIINGSGMKTKTCEAMMYGKVIFGTEESFEGYQLSKDCVVCSSDTVFISKINTYIDEGVRYFSTDNRDLFLQNYESGVVGKKFRDYFAGAKI